MHLTNDIKKTTFNFNFLIMAKYFFLSLIQGVTEFLPISSSSHLIIFKNIKFENQKSFN